MVVSSNGCTAPRAAFSSSPSAVRSTTAGSARCAWKAICCTSHEQASEHTHARASMHAHARTHAHAHAHQHTHKTHTHTHTQNTHKHYAQTFTRRTLSRRCGNGWSRTIGCTALLVIACGHLCDCFVGLSRHVVHSLRSGRVAGGGEYAVRRRKQVFSPNTVLFSVQNLSPLRLLLNNFSYTIAFAGVAKRHKARARKDAYGGGVWRRGPQACCLPAHQPGRMLVVYAFQGCETLGAGFPEEQIEDRWPSCDQFARPRSVDPHNCAGGLSSACWWLLWRSVACWWRSGRTVGRGRSCCMSVP